MKIGTEDLPILYAALFELRVLLPQVDPMVEEINSRIIESMSHNQWEEAMVLSKTKIKTKTKWESSNDD